MNKTVLHAAFALLFASPVSAYEITKTLNSDGAKDKNVKTESGCLKLVEHDACVELKISCDSSEGRRWDTSMLSSTNLTTSFQGLQNNKMHSPFQTADGRKVVMNFVGRDVEPVSLKKGEKYMVETYDLKNQSYERVGDFVVLSDPDWVTPPYPDKAGKPHPQVRLAMIYIPKDNGSVPEFVDCGYTSGVVDLLAVEKGRCVWVDKDSKAMNGKPYCW